MKTLRESNARNRAHWLSASLGVCLLSFAGGCAEPAVAPDQLTAGEPPAEAPSTPGRTNGRTNEGPVTIRTSEGTRQVTIERRSDGTLVFDGDIMITEAELAAARVGGSTRGAATTIGGSRWPNGRIPYEFHSNLPQANKDYVEAAIAHWQKYTPFTFVHKTTETNYVQFVFLADTCHSEIGRKGGKQEIQLGDKCNTKNTIHEIGHTIGLFHEQTRADRNTYVTINETCIEPNKEGNFSQYTTSNGADVGPYDYYSIMHYGPGDFIDKTQPSCDHTISTLQPNAPEIGKGEVLSAGDILAAWYIYTGVRPSARPAPADYNGDGITDMAIKDDAGNWYIDYADPTLPNNGFGKWDVQSPAYYRAGHGDASCIPVPVDYDGDGQADISVKCADGTWAVHYTASTQNGWNVVRTGYGDASCTPVPADYDGDVNHKADFAVKCTSGAWLIDYASTPEGWDAIRSGYGDVSCIPVPADYDGDGKADLSVKCGSGEWFVDYASSPGDGWNSIRSGYGDASCTPVPADYDGDGKADYSVKCTSGMWAIDYASSPGDGWNVMVYGYGTANSIPVPGNYDGVDSDGKRRADMSVKEVDGAGTWYIDYAGDNYGSWNFRLPRGV